MRIIVHHLFQKNPVWVAPMVLPVLLFGSGSMERALLFIILIGLGLPTVHVISFFIEAHLPRSFRLFSVLVVAASIFTVLEILFVPAGGDDPGAISRLTLLVRGLSVSGIVILPTVRAPRGERFSERIQHVLGLTLGFILGFVVFVALRLGLQQLAGREIQPVVAGFFLLAAGRIGYNLFPVYRNGTAGDSPSDDTGEEGVS